MTQIGIYGEEDQMTTQDMFQIAMHQSAEDIGCSTGDFLSDRNTVVPFKLGSKAKAVDGEIRHPNSKIHSTYR